MMIETSSVVCPLCGNPTDLLTEHHWYEGTQLKGVGICNTCNIKLGHLFKSGYPNWERQVSRMRKYFQVSNEACLKLELPLEFPNYPKVGLSPLVDRPKPTFSRRLHKYRVTVKDKAYEVVGYNNRKAKYAAVSLYRSEMGIREPAPYLLDLCKTEILGEILPTACGVTESTSNYPHQETPNKFPVTTGNKVVKYQVLIGSDSFEVEAVDNQSAKFTASRLFKKKYNLEIPVYEIAYYASTQLVKAPKMTTKELLKLLKEEPNG